MTIQQQNLDTKANKVPNPTNGNLIKTDAEGNPIDTGISASSINKNRTIWAYQDFNGGVITGTSVTLNNTSYSDLSFDASKIVNSAFIVRSDDLKKYAFTGATALFSTKIKVNTISGSSITLSGIPHSSYPIRIYYQYLTGFTPTNYTLPIKIISASALDELNPIIATQAELDGKLSISSNLSDLNNRQTALNNITDVSSATQGQILIVDTNNDLTFSNVPAPTTLSAGAIAQVMTAILATPLNVNGISKITFSIVGDNLTFGSSTPVTLSNGGFLVQSGYKVILEGFVAPYASGKYITIGWYKGTVAIYPFYGGSTTSNDTDYNTGASVPSVSIQNVTSSSYFYLYRTGGTNTYVYSGNVNIPATFIKIIAIKN